VSARELAWRWKLLEATPRPRARQQGGFALKRWYAFWSVAMGLLLGMGLLAVPGAARAQFQTEEVPELSRDWTIRAGLYIFNNETVRSQEGEVSFSGSVERTVYSALTYDVAIGIGFNGLDRVYSVPLMIHLIGHREKWRYGVSAGYSFGKRLDGRGISGAALGLLLGYQINNAAKYPMNVDLRYNFISGANNELDGYSLTLGIKF
jgi:hypothetical protein